MRVVIVAVALALSAAACTDPLFEGPREPLARGKELYDSCMPCHGKDGMGVAVAAAPEIAGLPEWYVEAQVMKDIELGEVELVRPSGERLRLKSRRAEIAAISPAARSAVPVATAVTVVM